MRQVDQCVGAIPGEHDPVDAALREQARAETASATERLVPFPGAAWFPIHQPSNRARNKATALSANGAFDLGHPRLRLEQIGYFSA